MRLCRIALATAATLLASIAAVPAVQGPEEHVGLDAGRLQQGHFEYRILESGAPVASIVLTVNRGAHGDFEFTGEANGKYQQRWESKATRALEPISATLRIGLATAPRVRMDLRYAQSRVTGELTSLPRKTEAVGEPAAAVSKAVDATLPARTVDQRIDWAAVLSHPLAAGRAIDFTVYDPSSGVSHVSGRVGDVEQITVPAGTFSVYRISYRIKSAAHDEPYELFATVQAPRVGVRELFPNGMATELVAMTPSR